jgi:2,4-didehydro-3-deoxy-L-rhamnonate hydrolase
MQICRFQSDRIGIVRRGSVHDVSAIRDRLGKHNYPLPRHDLLIAALPELREEIEALASTVPGVPLSKVVLDAPVANPGKLLAAPVNYIDHLEEAEKDLVVYFQQKVMKIQTIGLFLKATSSLIGESEPIRLRLGDRRNDHELELACIIGKRADNIPKDRALDYVAGWAVGLDITLRGPEERSMRKSIDTYSVLGPWMVTADELPDPAGLDMHLDVNGERRQTANTRDLILSVPELIEFATRYYTLEPGDVIYTGTPAGVGEIRDGDVVTATIERIGTLTARVVGAS